MKNFLNDFFKSIGYVLGMLVLSFLLIFGYFWIIVESFKYIGFYAGIFIALFILIVGSGLFYAFFNNRNYNKKFKDKGKNFYEF